MKILISQKEPSNMGPYEALKAKFGVEFEFKPFFVIQPLSAAEFRAQRINLADYTAVTFSSRHAIDAYFALCEEFRVKVPETMKYFCYSELIANYLQKHIVYRKRKIFFGDGTPASVVSQIGTKHKGEKFLVTSSSSTGALDALFKEAGINYSRAVIVKSVSQDISSLRLEDYGLIVLYNPHDLTSLRENFPDFQQGDIKFLAYGKNILAAMEEAGLKVAAFGPTPECPSASKALELYLSK